VLVFLVCEAEKGGKGATKKGERKKRGNQQRREEGKRRRNMAALRRGSCVKGEEKHGLEKKNEENPKNKIARKDPRGMCRGALNAVLCRKRVV